MKRIFLSLFFVSAAFATEPEQKEAESVALRFSEALSQLDSKTIMQLAHPEIVEFFHGMLQHILDTQNETGDTAAILSAMRVENMDELAKLDGRDVTARFYDMLMASTTEEFKETSRSSKVSVVGSIQEGDIVNVITRTSASVSGSEFQVPSLVLVKKEGSSWLVLTTTQFEAMKSNVRSQGKIKE